MKIKHYAAVLLTLSSFTFTSCNDGELDHWDLVGLSVRSSIKNNTTISYQPTSVTLNISTNSIWKITLPTWMHADKTTGTGYADVVVNIDENDTQNARTGYITIYAGSTEPQGNVVGSKSLDVRISQQPNK